MIFSAQLAQVGRVLAHPLSPCSIYPLPSNFGAPSTARLAIPIATCTLPCRPSTLLSGSPPPPPPFTLSCLLRSQDPQERRGFCGKPPFSGRSDEPFRWHRIRASTDSPEDRSHLPGGGEGGARWQRIRKKQLKRRISLGEIATPWGGGGGGILFGE